MRRRLTAAAEAAHLEASKGRGPIASNALRLRQVLTRRVLVLAWRRWRLIDRDISRLVDLAQPAAGRVADLELSLTRH